MFVSKKSGINEWKNWAIGLVGDTMSSIDQATSRWFWNLINGLPRDYFAQTFDQVNYLDKRVWEGMFRARIDEIKEQLELGVSESMFEADLVKLQGLVGKYSLSPVTYEDGLEELENFISTLGNGHHYLKILREVRNEFREELKSQPALLKECIEGEVNLGKKEGAYYKSVSDDRSLKHAGPKRVVSKVPIPDKAPISRKGNSNSKLRNISKLLFSNPGQALTLFLAAQSAFASAANIQMSNSSAMENSVAPLSSDTFPLSQLRGDMSLSMKNNSTKGINSRFAEIYYGREGAREVLTYAQKSKSQDAERYKRSSESDSSDGFSSLSGSDEVEGLKIEKKKLEENLESIKEYSRISHANFTETISQLRRENEKLWKDVDNSKRSEIQTNNKMERDKESFLGRINELQGNITRLNNQLIKESRAFLPYVCIKDIESSRFDPAEKKLKEMNDDETKEVINRVYNNNAEGRFSLLLGFGKNLRSIPLTLSVYTSLDNEMRKANNGNNDIFKAIDLAKAVQSEVINQLHAPLELREKANNILKSLKDLTKNMAVKDLSDAMKNKTYDKGDRSSLKISNAVFSLNEELFKNLITKVIDDVYGKVDTGSVILDFIYQCQCTSRMYGYEALLNKMKANNHLEHGPAVLELARSIKDLMNGVVCSLSPEEKLVVRGLKNEFPDYLQAAIFAEKTCIKNVAYNEYMGTGPFGPCTAPGEKTNSKTWNLQSHKGGVYFTIKDILYHPFAYRWANDYVCESDQHTYNGGIFSVRHVNMIELQNTPSDDACYWEIVKGVNGVKMRNKKYLNNYLFSSDYQENGWRRSVNSGEIVSGSNGFDWKFEDCSDMRRRRDADEAQSYSNPSSYLSDIALEKTTGKNSSSISR